MEKTFIVTGILFVTLGIVSISPTFASGPQVYITNNTAKECAHAPCFLPYQVTVSLGDTVTWTNLDNKTHTVTTGTAKTGPVGNFDSGLINPGESFTQFFGTVGKYHYFDKTKPLMGGFVIVETGRPSHAELAWVNGSLNFLDNFGNNMSAPLTGQPVKITKDVYNSGGTNATSIMFRLKIKNETNFLVYDNIIKSNIGARETTPIGFGWLPEKPGIYNLYFDADPSNPIGDTNENNDISFDSLIVLNKTASTINDHAYQIDNNTVSAVPEFGPMASIILISSLTLIILSSKLKILNLRNN